MISESVKVFETRHRLKAISQKRYFYTILLFLAYISEFVSLLIQSYLEPQTDSADSDNMASDQGLYCLLIGLSIKNIIKVTKQTQHP